MQVFNIPIKYIQKYMVKYIVLHMSREFCTPHYHVAQDVIRFFDKISKNLYVYYKHGVNILC